MTEATFAERLDLHIENLVPGLAALAVLGFGWPDRVNWSLLESVVGTLGIVVVAYLLGVLLHTLSRVLFDRASETYTRARFFKRWCATKLVGVSSLSHAAINTWYNHYVTAALNHGEPNTANEVAKRRQAGRLVRSSLIPLWLTLVALSFGITDNLLGRIGMAIALLIVAYAILLILYTFAEVAIFHEAYFAAQLLGIAPRTENEAREPLASFQDLVTRARGIALPPAK